MKLNMWMIVNRLVDYDIKVQLDDMAEPELNSVLPIYAPGCVRIYEKGDDIICVHEQEYILIRNLNLSDGYMLIQSIFDWYQDWLERCNTAIMSGEFAVFAKECARAFNNPVLIQDSNYLILGMEGYYNKEELPPEWKYMLEQGQSSVEGYEYMASALRNAESIYRFNVRKFKGKNGSVMPYSGLHANVSFKERAFGKITVLEKNRELNRGDVCLLEYMSRRMAIYTAAVSGEKNSLLDTEILEALVTGQKVEYNQVCYFHSLITGGRKGRFGIFLIDYIKEERKGDQKALQLLKNIVYNQHPSVICLVVNGMLLLLLFSEKPGVFAEQIYKTLADHGYGNNLNAGLSLDFYNLLEARYYYEQAIYALQQGDKKRIEEFYTYAAEYMLNASGSRRICACEPAVRYMWEMEQEKRAYLETLKVYLQEERSAIRAAERLYIHKNTLTYRIKYLKETKQWNFEDWKIREYLKLSLYLLSK